MFPHEALDRKKWKTIFIIDVCSARSETVVFWQFLTARIECNAAVSITNTSSAFTCFLSLLSDQNSQYVLVVLSHNSLYSKVSASYHEPNCRVVQKTFARIFGFIEKPRSFNISFIRSDPKVSCSALKPLFYHRTLLAGSTWSAYTFTVKVFTVSTSCSSTNFWKFTSYVDLRVSIFLLNHVNCGFASLVTLESVWGSTSSTNFAFLI